MSNTNFQKLAIARGGYTRKLGISSFDVSLNKENLRMYYKKVIYC